METIIKIDVKKMKEDIKAKVELQKFYKNQRKTVKIVGERKMPASEATYKHQTNREDLRIMYAAYGLARGKSFTQIEADANWEKKYVDSTFAECHPLHKFQKSIDRILERYSYLEEVPVLEEK